MKVLITRTRTGNNSIMQSGCVIYIFSVNFFLNIKMSTVWNFNSVKSDAVKVLPNAFAYEKFINIFKTSQCTKYPGIQM